MKLVCRVNNILIIILYVLRYIYCFYLLVKGVFIYYIFKRLGYKNIVIIIFVYFYLLEEKFNEEDKKIIKILESM